MLKVFLTTLLLLTGTGFADTPAAPLAAGYSSLGYALPQAGSYKLPPFMHAADGEVLDQSGEPGSLHVALGNRYALLSFMYSACSDVNGCPLSAFVFYQLKSSMADDPVLADNLRLVSLSFDPERDTPDTMRLYANNFKYAPGGGEWRFLTTAGQPQLEPLLTAYGQDAQRDMSVDGQPGQDYSHVLRVFLIDPKKQVRNIYSVSFLHTDLILTDLKTLLMEEALAPPDRAAAAGTIEVATRSPGLAGPGDFKSGYASGQYETRSRALQHRRGRPADLAALIRNPPLGLPPLPIPQALNTDDNTIALGRKLFYDRRLSLNDTFSCAMCHVPEQGYTSNEISKAVGIEGRSVRRNTPTLLNVGYATRLFHDGREDVLSQQIWGPLLAKNEMGNPSIGHVINKIHALPDYRGLFETAFDGKAVSMQTLGDALTAYQLALNAADSPFDRWHYGHQEDAVSEQVKQGFALFTGKAGCSSCHLVGDQNALFSDYELHNTGVGYLSSQPDKATTRPVQLAPGVFVDVKQAVIESVGLPEPADLGQYEVTENPADRWKFKTPTLRNIALTAPYMHDGSLKNLSAVLDFYNKGGIANELLDPRIHPLGLEEAELADLQAFLESLTGSTVDTLVADAFAAPVSDIQANDPRWPSHPTGESKP